MSNANEAKCNMIIFCNIHILEIVNSFDQCKDVISDYKLSSHRVC